MPTAFAAILHLKYVLGSCISFHCNVSKQLKCVNVIEKYSCPMINKQTNKEHTHISLCGCTLLNTSYNG